MKNKTLLSIFPVVSILIILFTGCPYGYKHNEGKLPDHPVNLSDLNSQYDDRNLPAPWISLRQPIFFSSNRNTNGETYDIVWEHLYLEWDKESGVLTVDGRDDSARDYSFLDTIIEKITVPGNEYGPFFFSYASYAEDIYKWKDVLVYADDASENKNIKFVYSDWTGEGETHEILGPFNINFLNSDQDDYYPSFWGEGMLFSMYQEFEVDKVSRVFFSSNRNGNFDLYQTLLPHGNNFTELLKLDTIFTTSKLDILSSEANEKCPFMNGNLMIFTSDRPGGYGGYDLYYAILKEGQWSTPVNFGNKINTEYNEFRPVSVLMWEFNLDLMLFSSDRPGGIGGYDLYYVGIPKMME